MRRPRLRWLAPLTAAALATACAAPLQQRVSGETRARIVFQNAMGGGFRLVRLEITLDGAPIRLVADDGGRLNEAEWVEVYDGPVTAGAHTLAVRLVYRGHGLGVFAYLKGYTFRVVATHTLKIAPGTTTALTVRGYERVDVPLAERPAVDFRPGAPRSPAP
ncbi:MAG TPA: hypothetical protein VGQ83_14630 [Polyangia bacterium]